jgi:hypothetical protein
MKSPLQRELVQFTRLNTGKFEQQLAYYPPNSSGYFRHTDAGPDDGSQVLNHTATDTSRSVLNSNLLLAVFCFCRLGGKLLVFCTAIRRGRRAMAGSCSFG